MKLNNEQLLDKNSLSQVETGYNLLLEVPAGNPETNQIGTEIQKITAKQYYYDSRGILKSCPVILLGKSKTVSMELQPQRSEVSAVVNTTKEVEARYEGVVGETEEAEKNRVYAPEPGSIFGLLSVGFELVGSQLRKLRWN